MKKKKKKASLVSIIGIRVMRQVIRIAEAENYDFIIEERTEYRKGELNLRHRISTLS